MARPGASYGIDAPTVVRNLALAGVAALAAGVGLGFVAGWAAALAFVSAAALLGSAATMVFSSKVLKPRERDRILDTIGWRGNERVLDVGCGRGLFLIGAAKRLTSGTAIGIDIWQSQDQSGNDPEATLANAELEGVADRVEVRDGDARRLPFDDESFDVVLSSLVVHNIHAEKERADAIGEMVRVLRPGGQIAITDILHTTSYARLLADRGLNVRRGRPHFLFFAPSRDVFATKPPVAVQAPRSG